MSSEPTLAGQGADDQGVYRALINRSGGDRAVAEACMHIMDKFFNPYDPTRPTSAQDRYSGEWAV